MDRLFQNERNAKTTKIKIKSGEGTLARDLAAVEPDPVPHRATDPVPHPATDPALGPAPDLAPDPDPGSGSGSGYGSGSPGAGPLASFSLPRFQSFRFFKSFKSFKSFKYPSQP